MKRAIQTRPEPWLVAFLLSSATSIAVAQPVDFVRDVRPIFESRCYSCHGEEKQKSGLRLDIKAAAFRGGSGHAPDIVPGKPGESPLIHFVRGDDPEMQMPPPESGKGPLSGDEISILKRWIEQGATWPDGIDSAEEEDLSDHWSFTPVIRPEPPTAEASEWPRGEIDRFVLRRLREAGLSPSPETSRREWLRRVSFDLTGLPPDEELVDWFLGEVTEASYEMAVERLLESPRYGERWAQHWLDVVRFADTHGFEVNTERAFAWPYRDYVIQAFNADTPWDQFIREQIAGDAYGKAEATGFLVTAAALLPGQIGKDEESMRLARQDELGEIVINTGEAFLGLSIGCARCHDHKYDPISARDYYSMQAFFSGVRYGDRAIENPEVDAIVDRIRGELAPLENEISSYLRPSLGEEKRASVSANANVEKFPPVKATRVRFIVSATIDENKHEPYIDEFEVYDIEGRNVALSGTITSTTGSKPEAANDGVYGNASCWKSREKGGGSLVLEFSEPRTIERIVWGRDRTTRYPDRLASEYAIEVETAPGKWMPVADHANRKPFDRDKAKASLYQLDDILSAHQDRAREIIAQRVPLVKELQQYNGGKQLVFAAQSHSPEPMHLLNRGDPEQPKDEVEPASLSFLESVSLSKEAGDIQRRKTLADWIASPGNPLTARVAVNRIWQWHFGTGLVSTPNDFGNLGEKPSHPELLDWLAVEFVESGWSVKALHRKIVLSAAYRQRSEAHKKGIETDADVRLLWRFPPRRIEAEAIRDSILSVSGQLDTKMYGRGYDLFDSRGGTGGFRPIESHRRPEGRRRMIYAYKVRMEREGVFGAFDCPDAGQSAPRRSQSTTPIQALNLFNSQFTIDLADDFANRVQSDAGPEVVDQVRRAWSLAYGRDPDGDEISDAEAMVREHGLATLCRVLFNSNEFLFLP